MNKFFSAIKNKTVWIVIGVIAILAGACLYAIMTPFIYPVFDYPELLSAVLQIQGVEQKGYACEHPHTENFLSVAKTSNKALVATSPFSATLKFTARDEPQVVRIYALDVALDKPTEESYGGESYFSWTGGCFARNAKTAFTKDLDLKNEQTFTVELKRGLYVINVSTKWANIGQVVYAFLVEVK